MTTLRFALLSAATGASIALAWMAALAARSAYTITRGHRWYQIRQL